MAIPNQVSELTPAWFSEVLDANITAVDVLDAHTGTTGRARVRVAGDSSVPDTLFVKLQPFTPEQREFVRMVGMGIAEARLYATVGDELPVRIPKVWHSSFEVDDGSFIMVLEDLEASGCRFLSAEDEDVLDIAEALMDELAVLHAKYWGQDLSWLTTPSGVRNNERGANVALSAGGIMQSALDQFADEMPPEFSQLGELYITRFSDLSALYREGVRTLVHGDNHIGNLFLDADGTAGFYDWAIATSQPGMRDVSYFLCNSLPTDIRREHQEALINRYRAGLARHGITLDEQTAFDQYRLFVVYSWGGSTTTAAMGDRWQPIDIGRRAMMRGTEAIVDLDSVSLIRERLGVS
jgi:hypothetical protein